MSGRYEQDNKREIWIDKKLIGQPQIVSNYMLSIKKKTSSTRKAYLGYLIIFFNYLKEINVEVLDVKPMHIDSFIEYLDKNNNKEAIINAKLSAIISFYDFLLENDLIEKNPCSTKKKLVVKPKEKIVYMTDTEVNKLKQNIILSKNKYCNRDLCIIILGCATGLRVSAIVNIDLDDIDFEEKTITVIEKGDKKRTLYIGDNTINMIKRWLKDREIILNGKEVDALFISQRTHERLSVDAVQDLLRTQTKGFGKHITPHKMRSTAAMKLYDKTGDIYLTAQQLGHADIRNTMIYAKATEEKQKLAAELLD